jgi:hypothetical protein
MLIRAITLGVDEDEIDMSDHLCSDVILRQHELFESVNPVWLDRQELFAGSGVGALHSTS